MEPYVLQEKDFWGNVKQSSRSRHSFYSYSLWRARSENTCLTARPAIWPKRSIPCGLTSVTCPRKDV